MCQNLNVPFRDFVQTLMWYPTYIVSKFVRISRSYIAKKILHDRPKSIQFTDRFLILKLCGNRGKKIWNTSACSQEVAKTSDNWGQNNYIPKIKREQHRIYNLLVSSTYVCNVIGGTYRFAVIGAILIPSVARYSNRPTRRHFARLADERNEERQHTVE